MQPRSWSLRFVLALAVATTVWVGAAEFSTRALRARVGHPVPVASARVAGHAGSPAPAAAR